jgi:hypothetical protein
MVGFACTVAAFLGDRHPLQQSAVNLSKSLFNLFFARKFHLISWEIFPALLDGCVSLDDVANRSLYVGMETSSLENRLAQALKGATST